MTNIFDCFEFINFIANKYLNGYLSPQEISLALDNGQVLLFNKKLSDRQNGQELALVALKPFYKTTSVGTDSAGFVAYPTKWAETQAMYKDVSGVTLSVKQVFHNELQDALSSGIYPIASNPRWLEQQGGVTVYPKESQSLSWHYLSSPVSPNIGFTVSGNGIIYDPTTSIQLEFDSQYWMEIIYLALPSVGVNLSDQEISGLVNMYSISNSDATAN